MKECIKKGSIVEGEVTGIEDYGIFVHINNDYSGLVHISEISEDFVKDINSFVVIGEKIYCQVLEVLENEKKLKLSIKDINYKSIPENSEIQETRLGFLPLKTHLNQWIEEKLKIYKQ